MASCYVGVYWGAREESREACADRLSAFLHALATQDVTLSKWFKKANSRVAASVPLPNDAIGIGQLLKTNKRDVGHEVIHELGFSFSGWTQSADSMIKVSLSATCGGYSLAVGNTVVVSFQAKITPNSDLLKSILKSAVEVFDPDSGVVNLRVAMPAGSAEDWGDRALFYYKKGVGISATGSAG